MEVKLIVCDIEGCIMPSKRESLELRDVADIANYCRSALSNSGLPPLVLCTGRQIPYAESVAQLISAMFPGFPSVVENGAFLYDIASNDIKVNPAINGKNADAWSSVRSAVDALINRVGGRKEYGKEICISVNPPLGTAIEELFGVFSEELDQFSDVAEVTHSQSAVDVTPVGVDKASGVRYLSQVTGIPVEAMVGIGDSRGDIPMLQTIGIPTAPANAVDDVKSVARYVSNYPGPRGVSDVISRFTRWKVGRDT